MAIFKCRKNCIILKSFNEVMLHRHLGHVLIHKVMGPYCALM